MSRFFNYKILLLLIFILAIFLRIWNLDKVPTGVSDDELGFILNSKAVFLTGKDIAGNWSPYSLTTITGEFPQAELPYLFMAPFIGILPLSIFYSKIPYVVISLITIILLFLITKKIIGGREAIFVCIAATFNPWSIFFGRTAYEAPLAMFFYLLSFYILLIAKRAQILLAFIPLFLGFYMYMGTKIVLVFFVLIISIYSYFIVHNKKYLKYYILLNTLCFLLMLIFVFLNSNQPAGSRIAEITLPNSMVISDTVNEERRLSIDNALSIVFSNKIVVWIKYVIDKYLKVFSTELLFVHGEARSTFSLWYHGYFYYTDIFFLAFGYFILLKRKRFAWITFTSLILVAPIPSVLSNVGTGFVALRSVLLFPLFVILIGVGICYFYEYLRDFKVKLVVSFILVIIYIVQVLNFVNIYFFRNPIYNSEAFSLSERLVSKYTTLAKNRNLEVIVISRSPKNSFKHYIFNTNSYNANYAGVIKDIYRSNQLNFLNSKFKDCEKISNEDLKKTIIVDSGIDCESISSLKKNDNLSISYLKDGGTIYKIHNDIFCRRHTLNRYPSNFELSDFDVENLSEKRFCEKFIVDPNIK